MIFKATPNSFHPSFFSEMTPYKFCILWKWPFTQFPIAKFTTHLIYSRVLLFTAVTSNFNSRPLLHALTKTNQYFENDPQENLVGALSIVLSPDNVIATSKKNFINFHSAAFVTVLTLNLVHAYKFRIFQKLPGRPLNNFFV